MVFSDINFLFLFLPIVLVLYFGLKAKNLVLLIVSLVFYAWGEPIYVSIMILSIIVDYSCGRLIDKHRSKARLFLLISIFVNLGMLGFFKYGGFIIDNINSAFSLNIDFEGLPLPIGISFYTFQTMSYTIDVYRGRVPAQKNIIAFGAFVSMFPQLIAGPIVRYKTIAEQLESRKVTLEGFGIGAKRFILGLGKKVLIANNIGMLWEQARLMEGTALTAWLGIIAFALQLYFDFSGYSDMAIGLGRMFGFDFPENFNAPYRSTSISDFWRRWHMTLGEWFRDYVYFPLGGSKCKKGRMVLNLAIVWLITGLWHGADWNFVVWGAYFGVFIIMEKLFLGNILNKIHVSLRVIYSLFIVLIGWVLFASSSIENAFAYIGNMFSGAFIDDTTLYMLSNYGVLLVICIVLLLPFRRLKQSRGAQMAGLIACLPVFIMSVAYLVDSTFNPFLYFRF